MSDSPKVEVQEEKKEKRISIEIPEDMHRKLKIAIPWGIKSQLVRSLLDAFFEAQDQTPNYIVKDLFDGQYILVKRPAESVQILNGPEQ